MNLWVIPLLALALLSGCEGVGVHQELTKEVFYKRDMRLDVNGLKGEGVLVVPESAAYRISGESKGELDLFTLETCHREHSAEKLKDKRFSFQLQPVPGIEAGTYCPVELGGYEKAKGRHSWGLIDVETPDATLPADMCCNGVCRKWGGVSICQSKAGLLQSITFPVPVEVDPDPGCELGESADGKIWQFHIPPRKCVLVFSEIAAPHQLHRLTTLGYDGILIRED